MVLNAVIQQEYYKTHPKCTFDTQKQLSEDIKQIIQNYERGNQN